MKMPNLLVLVLRERKKLWCTRSLPDEGFWRPMTSPVQRMVETYDPLHPDLIIDNQGIHSCDYNYLAITQRDQEKVLPVLT